MTPHARTRLVHASSRSQCSWLCCSISRPPQFALPLEALFAHHRVWTTGTAAMRAFFELSVAVDRDYFYHDDVWTSSFLQDAMGVAVCPVTMGVSGGGGGNALARTRAPPQFTGPVHGLRETWSTALRRLGGNATRRMLNVRLGGARQRLRQLARERGLVAGHAHSWGNGDGSSEAGPSLPMCY